MRRLIRCSTASAVGNDQVSWNNAFFKAFTAEVCSTLFNDWSDNYDELCLGPEPKERFLSIHGWLKRWIRRWLKQLGYQKGAEVVAIFRTAFDLITPYLQRLEQQLHQLELGPDVEVNHALLHAGAPVPHRKAPLPLELFS